VDLLDLAADEALAVSPSAWFLFVNAYTFGVL